MLFSFLSASLNRKKENFEDGTAVKWTYFTWVVFAVMLVFDVVFGVFSAYLSWSSNGLVGWNVYWKTFFSFFAFITGISYVWGYLIFKLDLVMLINKLQGRSFLTLL